MKPLNRLIRPLSDAARVFFKADISLRREAGGLHLVLEERGPDGRVRETPEQARVRRERELLAQMQQELAEALDSQPGTREALRHLVYFEAKFRRKGLRALQRMPVPLLRKALEQFEALVSNWAPVGLATLRSKMAVAVIEREHECADDTTSQGPDSTLEDERLLAEPEVQELGVTGLPEADAAAELAAAYAAALGAAATPPSPQGAVEVQGELGSRSGQRTAQTKAQPPAGAVDIRLRELQP
jgi:hypothetical protein